MNTQLPLGFTRRTIDSVNGLTAALLNLSHADQLEILARQQLAQTVNDNDAAQTQALNNHKTTEFLPLKSAFDAANADETTAGSIRKFAFDKAELVKDQIINGATGIWQTLQGIQAYVEVNGAESITAAILDAVTKAKLELRDGVDSAMDTFAEVKGSIDTLTLQVNQNLTNLETTLKDFSKSWGSNDFIDEKTASVDGKVVLTYKPKNGLASISGMQAMNVDANGNVSVIFLTADASDASGKTFSLNASDLADVSGKVFIIQYASNDA